MLRSNWCVTSRARWSTVQLRLLSTNKTSPPPACGTWQPLASSPGAGCPTTRWFCNLGNFCNLCKMSNLCNLCISIILYIVQLLLPNLCYLVQLVVWHLDQLAHHKAHPLCIYTVYISYNYILYKLINFPITRLTHCGRQPTTAACMLLSIRWNINISVREAVNHFAKKTLAERGGTPPLTENHKKNSKTMGQKGLKLAFFGQKKPFFSGFFP